MLSMEGLVSNSIADIQPEAMQIWLPFLVHKDPYFEEGGTETQPMGYIFGWQKYKSVRYDRRAHLALASLCDNSTKA